MRPGRDPEAVVRSAGEDAARFGGLAPSAGHYESFYLKLSRPGGGRAIWIRHTVHKRPGKALTGALWFTLFDADAPGPRAAKLAVPATAVGTPAGAWVEVAGARLAPGRAAGRLAGKTGVVDWELEFDALAGPFHHLPYRWLYRTPLPRTKLLSPVPDARFSGVVTFDGERLELDAWPGMVGHNWGAEHAERWSWIQANELHGGRGWFDAALGRIKVGRSTTPWIANGMLSLDGELHRLGGLERIRSTEVAERPGGCEFELGGRGVRVRGRVGSERRNFVAWVYADPVGPEHQVLNCSIADLELSVERRGQPPRRLGCAGAAAYELGIRESDHGIPLQPYADG
jgi:hypothetical protein